MSKPHRLPLDSPLWNHLGTFGVASERIPLLLQKLIEEPVNPAAPALDELMVAIFHQYSLAHERAVIVPDVAAANYG